MPEGDLILYNSLILNKKLKNGIIKKMDSIIINEKIVKISCKGKLLFIELENEENEKFIHIHLGLRGSFSFENEKNIRHILIIEKNNKNINLNVVDTINLSKMEFLTKQEHEKQLNKLGISIFEMTEEYFLECCKNSKQLLCSFLMAQNKFSGIGNYMKNEIIFLSKIDIHIKMNELTEKNKKDIYNNILFVAFSNLMTYLQETNTENLLDSKYKKNIPFSLEIPYKLKIYKQIEVKGKKVKKIKISGRDTYFIE